MYNTCSFVTAGLSVKDENVFIICCKSNTPGNILLVQIEQQKHQKKV